jgi:hypothetical protein
MHRKKKILIAGTAIVAIGAGTAFAYWSTTGSGSGSGATSAGASSLVITQTSTISNMFPGDAAQSIAGTVKNTAENAAYVNTVTVSIASVDKAAGATGDCDASDYTLASPVMTIAQDLAAGATKTFSGATIKFNNKAANQDGCKGATVNLAYASN